MQLFKSRKGFTLVELLVVVAIIGILVSLVILNTLGTKPKANDAQRKSDMRQVATAQEMYYGENNDTYFTGDTGSQDDIPIIGTYLIKTLRDPVNINKYRWLDNRSCTSAGQRFCAYAVLENQYSGCSNRSLFIVYDGGTRELCSSATFVPGGAGEPANGCSCNTATF